MAKHRFEDQARDRQWGGPALAAHGHAPGRHRQGSEHARADGAEPTEVIERTPAEHVAD